MHGPAGVLPPVGLLSVEVPDATGLPCCSTTRVCNKTAQTPAAPCRPPLPQRQLRTARSLQLFTDCRSATPPVPDSLDPPATRCAPRSPPASPPRQYRPTHILWCWSRKGVTGVKRSGISRDPLPRLPIRRAIWRGARDTAPAGRSDTAECRRQSRRKASSTGPCEIKAPCPIRKSLSVFSGNGRSHSYKRVLN